MKFEKFGVKGFVLESKAEKFVTYLAEGKVMTTKCKKCQHSVFPPKMDCLKCGTSEVEWVEIEGAGILQAFSTVMYGPDGFENQVPYTIAVIKFPSGIKMLGQVDNKILNEDIKVGMNLKVVPVKLADNRVSYQFTIY